MENTLRTIELPRGGLTGEVTVEFVEDRTRYSIDYARHGVWYLYGHFNPGHRTSLATLTREGNSWKAASGRTGHAVRGDDWRTVVDGCLS